VILGLAACQPGVPDSGAGVGFGDYQQYQLEQARVAREQQLAGMTGAPRATGAPTAAEIAAAGIGTGPAPAVGAPLDATGRGAAIPAGAALAADTPGISDEQDFTAVAGRESIESDAQRLQRQRAQRIEVAPVAVPQRPGGDGGPNIVAFALSTTNAVGQPVHSRTLASPARAARACDRFSSPDLAQEAFLAAGGPQRDRRGLDPDGDGFACQWDPRPYRRGLEPVAPDRIEPEG
jgi:hypothetical protein